MQFYFQDAPVITKVDVKKKDNYLTHFILENNIINSSMFGAILNHACDYHSFTVAGGFIFPRSCSTSKHFNLH
jgi:hypothetical protein